MGPKLWNTRFGAGSPEQLGLGSHKTTGPGEVNAKETEKQKQNQQFKGHLDFTGKKLHLLTLELLPN